MLSRQGKLRSFVNVYREYDEDIRYLQKEQTAGRCGRHLIEHHPVGGWG